MWEALSSPYLKQILNCVVWFCLQHYFHMSSDLADGDIYLYNKPGGQGTGGKGNHTTFQVCEWLYECVKRWPWLLDDSCCFGLKLWLFRACPVSYLTKHFQFFLFWVCCYYLKCIRTFNTLSDQRSKPLLIAALVLDSLLFSALTLSCLAHFSVAQRHSRRRNFWTW